MMALNRKRPEHEPGELEMLLPWYAAGTLEVRDVRRIEDALACDPDLAGQFETIKQEYAATIDINERLSGPAARAMQQLLEAIEQEPARGMLLLPITGVEDGPVATSHKS